MSRVDKVDQCLCLFISISLIATLLVLLCATSDIETECQIFKCNKMVSNGNYAMYNLDVFAPSVSNDIFNFNFGVNSIREQKFWDNACAMNKTTCYTDMRYKELNVFSLHLINNFCVDFWEILFYLFTIPIIIFILYVCITSYIRRRVENYERIPNNNVELV